MKNKEQSAKKGFTLIETLVAISLLMLAVVAPMSLAAQSLVAAYYSRSQITAFYLAQEAIEAVRSMRDANILANAENGTSNDVFSGIPYGTSASNAQPFTVDALQSYSAGSGSNNVILICAAAGCPPLLTNSSLYGYDDQGGSIGGDCPHAGSSWTSSTCSAGDGWTVTPFTRTVKAYLTNSSVNASNPEELRVSVKVTWVEGSLKNQSFTINEDMYAWLQ